MFFSSRKYKEKCPLFASAELGGGKFIVGGGGGAAKTGVPNLLTFWRAEDANSSVAEEIYRMDTLEDVIGCLRVDTEKKHLVCGSEGHLLVLDISSIFQPKSTSARRHVPKGRVVPLSNGLVKDMQSTDNGTQLLLGCEDGTVLRYPYPSLDKPESFRVHEDAIVAVRCSGNRIVVVSSSKCTLHNLKHGFTAARATINASDIDIPDVDASKFRFVFRGVECIKDCKYIALLVTQFKGASYLVIYAARSCEIVSMLRVLDHPCTALTSSGDELFLGSNRGRIVCINVADPTKPRRVGHTQLDTSFPLTSLTVEASKKGPADFIVATGIDGVMSLTVIKRRQYSRAILLMTILTIILYATIAFQFLSSNR